MSAASHEIDGGMSETLLRNSIWPIKNLNAGNKRSTSYADALSLSLVHLMRCQSIRTISDLGRRNSDMLARWISQCDQVRGTNTGNPLSAMIFVILSWTCEKSPVSQLPYGYPEFPPALPLIPTTIRHNLRVRLVQCSIGCTTLPKEVAHAIELGLQPIIFINMFQSLQATLFKKIRSSILDVQLNESDFGANRQIVEDSMMGPMTGIVFALAHQENQSLPRVKFLCDRHTFSVSDLSILDPCGRGIQFMWVDVIGLDDVVKQRVVQSSMLQNLGISKQKSDQYAILLRDNKVMNLGELEAYGAKSIPSLVSFLQNKIGMNQKEIGAIKFYIENKIQSVQQLNLYVECLKPVPIFKDNTADEILDIARLAHCKSYQEKQPIVRQGEPGRHFYVILEGHATVNIKGIGQVADLGPKKFFGEIALLKDVPRTATVLAHNHGPIKCKCLTIEREAFENARIVAAENKARKDSFHTEQKRQQELLSNFGDSHMLIHALLQYRDQEALYTGTVNIFGNEHGYGRMESICGFCYDGLWTDGVAHGTGRLEISDARNQGDQPWRWGHPEDASLLFSTCSPDDSKCHSCLFFFALCLLHGSGVQKNEIQAFQILQTLHERGHCDSSFLIAHSLESSKCNDAQELRDAQARAFEIFLKAAQKGHAPSQLRAAFCLDAGRGVLKSEKEAFGLLLPLASTGHAIAQYHVGVYYECGFGVSPDYAKCIRWLRWSSQQGYFPAIRRLTVVGALYPEGNAVWPEDDD